MTAYVRYLLIGAFTVLCLGCAGVVNEKPRPDSLDSVIGKTRITYANWVEQWTSISTLPDAQIVTEQQFILVTVPSEHSQYYFTSVVHPAYPATMKRSVQRTANDVFLLTAGWYVYESDAFNHLYQQFLDNTTALVERIKKTLSANAQKSE